MLHAFYGRLRHPKSALVADAPPTGTIDDVAGRRHCLVVTYRRDGTPVATPVWFGVANGRIFFRAERDTGKAKRLRSDTRVRVAPCTGRGRPLSAPFEGKARIITDTEAHAAEHVIQSNYSLGRRIYERWFTAPEGVYVEVTPIVNS
jgi:PPOX class probable F420-dependent enzyme